MKIPKYITHPLLLLVAFGGLYALMRLGSISMQDMQNVHRIATYDMGKIGIADNPASLMLDAPAFTKVSEDKNKELQRFFVGKYLKMEALPHDGKITLPITLYDGGCFTPKDTMIDPASCRPIQITP